MITNFLDQAWKRVPLLMAVGFSVYFIVLVTIGMTNFVNRVNVTAELTNDINVKQLPEIRGRLTGLETRMTGLETRMTGLETRMTGLETRMTGLETRMSQLEKEMKEVVLLLKELKTEIHSRKSP
ncbi:MAG TPA: hypothetical protein VFE50_10820 [Cyclobacteriaceae bacterium]|nr:hypothetical protein [Cyclobacteriaceae bacterium]